MSDTRPDYFPGRSANILAVDARENRPQPRHFCGAKATPSLDDNTAMCVTYNSPVVGERHEMGVTANPKGLASVLRGTARVRGRLQTMIIAFRWMGPDLLSLDRHFVDLPQTCCSVSLVHHAYHSRLPQSRLSHAS